MVSSAIFAAVTALDWMALVSPRYQPARSPSPRSARQFVVTAAFCNLVRPRSGQPVLTVGSGQQIGPQLLSMASDRIVVILVKP